MTGLWVAAAVVVLLLVAVVAWCSWTATRLDRLQVRCEATRAMVSEQLARRSALALDLAASSWSERGRSAHGSAISDVARRARDAKGFERWIAESELTRALADVRTRAELQSSSPLELSLLRAIEECQLRASVTRRIHNDAAALALALHRRSRVRWFRLAGRSVPPEMIEYDDGTR